jgi:Skp family chaperone for outer membrane proteins
MSAFRPSGREGAFLLPNRNGENEMPETTLPAETAATTPVTPAASAAPAPESQVTPPAEPAAGEEPFDQARAMKLIEKFRGEEKEWKKQQKELETLRAEKQKQAEAEMTEAQRLQKQADEVKAENARLQAEILRRDVIAETGLPSSLADRLKGATKEELLADAKQLLAILPPQKPSAPAIGATNPANGQTTETEAQKRERLFGRQGNPFDMDTIIAQGGGVKWK